MSAAPSPTPPRRRWWVRVLLWLTALSFVCFAVLVGAVWWLWTHPERAFQMAVERLDLPFKPVASAVKIERGTLRLDDFSIRDRSTGQPWVESKSVTWSGRGQDLGLGKLGRIAVDGLHADIDAPLATQLEHWFSAPSASKSGPSLRLDQLDLTNASLKLAATDSWPAVECRIDHRAERVDLSDPAHPRVQHFRIAVKEARVDGHEIPQANAEGSLSRDGELTLDHLVLARGHAAPSPWLLRNLAAPTTPTVTTAPPMIRRVKLTRLELSDFSLENGDPQLARPAWWPHLTGRLSCRANDIFFDDVRGLSLGPVQIEVRDVQWHPPTGPGRVTLPAAELKLASWHDDGVLHILDATLHQPVIEWRQDVEDALMPQPTVTQAPPRPPLSFQIDHASLDQAALSLQRTRLAEFEGKTVASIELNALRFDSNGITSSKPQTLTLRDLALASHPASREQALEPFVKLERGNVAIVPVEWQQHSTLAEFTLVKPEIVAHDGNVPWLKPQPSATPSTTTMSPIKVKQVTVTDGSLDIATMREQRIELKTAVAITTEAGEPHLRLQRIKAQLPQHAKLPIASIDEIEVAIRWPDLWERKRLQSLRINGGELDVGDALMSLGNTTASAPAAAPSPSPLSGWRVNEVTIENTAITLQRLAPGLPPVKFNLDYHASDLPLEPTALAGNFEPQRIELSQLSIKSPYDPLRNVADLGHVFVGFTLDSLFQQRIDKVEIVAPTLYVGEDLFWYIDYYRKYAAGQPLPGSNESRMALASVDQTFALGAAVSAATAPIKEGGAWTVDVLKVDGGKLIIAPKGRPLPGIPRPFPFSFTTHLNQGKLEAEFDIPSDTYTWEQMKLQLERMRGRVQFNLPIKTVDNNLTETFRVDRIRYKELHMEDAHLSVTYDANGIYGQFGGAAYGGYVNGAFNVYLDNAFSWDGWISGTDVRTTEITRQMCPAYFLLDGKVATTVVAQGNMNEVYQCDVKFKNASPGKFSVVALNNMLSDLPKEVATYEDDLMRIGVETLRDFEYDKVDAQARFYGREGKGFLRLSGANGSRNIDVNLYDHRWTDKKPSAITRNDTP